MAFSKFGLLVQLGILVVWFLITALLEYEVLFMPAEIGFWRDDPVHSYPFVENETVSTSVLVVLSAVLPGILLFLGEFYRKKQNGEEDITNPAFWIVIAFMMGLVTNVFTTTWIKFLAGSLRPDFINRCQPNYSLLDDPATTFIVQDICTGDSGDVSAGRQSFPSGHSSSITYAMTFLIVYIQYSWRDIYTFQNKTTKELSYFLLPLSQLVFACIAIFVATSRFTDYRHFFTDILAGMVLGATIAPLFYFKVYSFVNTEPEDSVLPITAEVDVPPEPVELKSD